MGDCTGEASFSGLQVEGEQGTMLCIMVRKDQWERFQKWERTQGTSEATNEDGAVRVRCWSCKYAVNVVPDVKGSLLAELFGLCDQATAGAGFHWSNREREKVRALLSALRTGQPTSEASDEELDSPPFKPQALVDFERRGYERVNRTNEALTPATVRADGVRHHLLKTWPFPFDDVASGAKPFEYRRHDRDYRVGDILVLEKWDPDTKRYLGDLIRRRVTYLLPGGTFGVPNGYCVLGLGSVPRTETPKTSGAGGGTDLREGAGSTGSQVTRQESVKQSQPDEAASESLTAKVTASGRDNPNTTPARGPEEAGPLGERVETPPHHCGDLKCLSCNEQAEAFEQRSGTAPILDGEDWAALAGAGSAEVQRSEAPSLGLSFSWDTVDGEVAYSEDKKEWTLDGAVEGHMSSPLVRQVLAKLVAPDVGGEVECREGSQVGEAARPTLDSLLAYLEVDDPAQWDEWPKRLSEEQRMELAGMFKGAGRESPTNEAYQDMQRNFVEVDSVNRELRAELDALRKVAEAALAIDGDLSTATNPNYVALREAIRALPSSSLTVGETEDGECVQDCDALGIQCPQRLAKARSGDGT